MALIKFKVPALVPVFVTVPEEISKLPSKLSVPAFELLLVEFKVPPSTVKFPSTFKIPAPPEDPIANVPAVTFKFPATPMVFPFKEYVVVLPPIIKLLYCLAGEVTLVVKVLKLKVPPPVFEYLTVLPVMVVVPVVGVNP